MSLKKLDFMLLNFLSVLAKSALVEGHEWNRHLYIAPDGNMLKIHTVSMYDDIRSVHKINLP